MKITLPSPGPRYDPQAERARNDSIAQAFQQARGRREHLEVSPPELLILSSPDGTRWKIEVTDLGAVTATAL